MQDYLKKIKTELMALFGYLLIRFLALTIKIERVHEERLKNVLADKGQRVIYCFWHDRLLMMPLIALGEKVNILSSLHRDSDYIVKVTSLFGYKSIRGSSTRGGSSAFRKMVREMKAGWHSAFTPDGPKGPRHIAKKGAILLASLTGSPLIPVAFSCSKKKHFQAGIIF